MEDAYKLAIDAFDILVKEKTLGRLNVPVGKKARASRWEVWNVVNFMGCV